MVAIAFSELGVLPGLRGHFLLRMAQSKKAVVPACSRAFDSHDRANRGPTNPKRKGFWQVARVSFLTRPPIKDMIGGVMQIS